MTIVERALEFVSDGSRRQLALQAIVDAIGGVGSMRIERRAGDDGLLSTGTDRSKVGGRR